MPRRIESVAIVGGGPTGAALGTYLARSGRRVVLFDSGKRPPLVIGESLVPAVVPFLRDLGIEDEVRDYSVYKPGATFVLRGSEMSFRFSEVRGAKTTYSYNVPRDKLDASILSAARAAGVLVIDAAARLERDPVEAQRARLCIQSLDAARPFLDGQPDFIVDTSGRARLLARLFDLPREEGGRKDTALFAHCQGVPLRVEGNVHTDLLERGWSWRIPLPGRVSVGFVLDTEFIKTFGASSEEQFDRYLAENPTVKAWGGEPRRISPVLKYSNYQLTTLSGLGPNWALAGDAFGFIDPVFSSGLLVSLDSARELARAIEAGSDAAFRKYERRVLRHLENWRQVVDHFYSGRLFTLFRVGEVVRETPLGKVANFHLAKHLPRVFTGEATTARYSVSLLDFMCNHALVDNDPDELAVR